MQTRPVKLDWSHLFLQVDEHVDNDDVTFVELKAQVTSAELKNKRLMEVFKKTSQNFREVCYALLGYRIDLVSDNQYKLQNMYAESPEDILLFQVGLFRWNIVRNES